MKKQLILVLLLTLFSFTLIVLGYYLPRTAIFNLFLFFGISYGIFISIYHFFKQNHFSIWWGIGAAVCIRLLLFGAMPMLSDDFYRFVWDGHLVWNGINPYLFNPMETMDLNSWFHNSFFSNLLDQMNSPEYYTVYTPLNQFFFMLAAGFGGQDLFLNLLWLKIFLLIFELINFYLLFKILSTLRQPAYRLLLYALNPLVILETAANVHFEALVLTGLLGTVYGYLKMKPFFSATFWSLAVATKLTPLMFGPLLMRAFKLKPGIRFFAVSGFLIFLALLPLLWDKSFEGFMVSLKLFQGKFEFNASLYYLLREVGIWWLGYNPIATLSPLLNLVILLLILLFVSKAKEVQGRDFVEFFIKIYLIYFLLQPVVHPWYIIPALGLSIFTEKKAFLAWSGLIFLSYHAYAHLQFEENGGILLLEYLVLFLFIIWDYLGKFAGKPVNTL